MLYVNHSKAWFLAQLKAFLYFLSHIVINYMWFVLNVAVLRLLFNMHFARDFLFAYIVLCLVSLTKNYMNCLT